ncbi:MAG: endo-1,4-beta-xylanase [Silvibacterium sp.]|nr:endo-1,4-beta-xylanase [Silvibacterium sp.]MBV8438743.1 endo-1,4-beta-xylanase [Silvibacterium sp.]
MKTRREFLRVAAVGAAASATQHLWAEQTGRTAAVPDVSGANSLQAHADAHGLLVGCAVVPEKLTGEPEYAGLVSAQSNILVPENAMKWKALRPAPDKFNFSGADTIVAFASAHGRKVRGHNLCWHVAIPDWFAATVTKDNARQILTEHIRTVAGRYAGKLHSWDVVNEAIDPKSGLPNGMRKSPWLELVGPDYVDLAFRTAREADPAPLLTYNDYAIETDAPDETEKREAVLALVRGMKKRGVPIDAVGVQSHLKTQNPAPGKGLRDFVRELRQMGLRVFVTELDVDEKKLEGSESERDAAIARIYRDYVTMMVAEPNVDAVLTWGITDRYTWLNGPKWARPDGKPQRCLPFYADYEPAPAFFALRDAVDTRLAGR